MWETESSNWPQFMLQWFILFPEFTFNIGKNSSVFYSSKCSVLDMLLALDRWPVAASFHPWVNLFGSAQQGWGFLYSIFLYRVGNPTYIFFSHIYNIALKKNLVWSTSEHLLAWRIGGIIVPTSDRLEMKKERRWVFPVRVFTYCDTNTRKVLVFLSSWV